MYYFDAAVHLRAAFEGSKYNFYLGGAQHAENICV